jgi:hypothetical protein
MNAESHSASLLLRARLNGPLVRGRVLGRQHLQFGDYVVSLTPPGSPRMPNGIACAVQARADSRVAMGGGRLFISDSVIWPGPEWNPLPSFAGVLVMPAAPEPLVSAFAGLGPGLTPAGDDLLAGYIAGLVLLHVQRNKATRLAEDAAARTGSLSATLLRHAALGEVPEPVHNLLATGDARPLLSFGHSSGAAWLRGLVSAGYLFEVPSMPNPASRVTEGVH